MAPGFIDSDFKLNLLVVHQCNKSHICESIMDLNIATQDGRKHGKDFILL